ncbi:hypothetical protein DFS34DRAFT_639274 [Phlyctochytrium arcticum]|nr:hypothetical protein DFS34DRAFT_639274 [Phlyctochytrium arcticum]
MTVAEGVLQKRMTASYEDTFSEFVDAAETGGAEMEELGGEQSDIWSGLGDINRESRLTPTLDESTPMAAIATPEIPATLAWTSEHSLLGDIEACTPTDEFSLTPAGRMESDHILGSDKQSGGGDSEDDSDPGEDSIKDSKSTEMAVSADAIPSSEGHTDASQTEQSLGAGNADHTTAKPDSPFSPSTTSSSHVERRITRGKTNVNYKALLDGPSIARKLVPPKKPSFNEDGERVYCTCRQPDTGKFMIQCDNCEEWFHGKCVDLTKKVGQQLSTYHCPQCREILGHTKTADSHPKAESSSIKESSKAVQKSPVAVKRETPVKVSRPTNRKPIAVDASPQVINSKCILQDCPNRPIASTHFCSQHCAHKYLTISRGWLCGSAICRNPPAPSASFCSRACEIDFGKELVQIGKIDKSSAAAAAELIPTQILPGTIGSRPIQSVPLPPAWTKSPVRRAARRNFEETFANLFADAQANPELYDDLLDDKINLADPKAYVAQLEEALFEAYATPVRGDASGTLECGQAYKAKFRSLQFNLKDAKNMRLKRRVLCGDVSPQELVRLPPEDLGNDDVKAAAEEVRRRSLRDAVRVNNDAGSYLKKTHKGEIEVVRPARIEVNAATVHMEQQHQIAKNVGIATQRREDVVQSAHPSEHASIPENNDADDKSPTIDGPAKRPITEDEEMPESKRLKEEDETSPSELTGALQPNGSETNVDGNSHAVGDEMTSRLQPESDSEQPREELVLDGDAAGDNYEYEADNMDVDASTAVNEEPEAIAVDLDLSVWKGRVHMPQVGKFSGSCKQVCGRPIGDMKAWEDILPPTISIDGRVAAKHVEKYIQEQRKGAGKQVVAIEFYAGEDTIPEGMDAALARDEKIEDETGFAALIEYFRSRQRLAVVGHHYVSIRDMYILPLTKDEPLPAFLTDLEDCRIPDAPRQRDTLIGLIILSSAFARSSSEHEHSPTRDTRDKMKVPVPGSERSAQSSPVPTPPPAIPNLSIFRNSTPAGNTKFVPTPNPFQVSPAQQQQTNPRASHHQPTHRPLPPQQPKRSLLDTFAPLPATSSIPTSAAPLLQQQSMDTTAMLTSLLSNPQNLGLVSSLFAQLTQQQQQQLPGGTNRIPPLSGTVPGVTGSTAAIPASSVNTNTLLSLLAGGAGVPGLSAPLSSSQSQHPSSTTSSTIPDLSALLNSMQTLAPTSSALPGSTNRQGKASRWDSRS